MKLPALLFALLSVPLVAVTGPAASRQESGFDAYSLAPEVYYDQPPPSGGRGGPFDYPYPGSDEQARFQDDEPGWVREPYQPPPIGSRLNQSPGGAYPPPAWSPDDATMYGPYGYPGIDAPPERAERGYSDRPALGGLPPAVPRGYRFRGDSGSGGAGSWRGGYRFRPLTEQEQQRMRSDDGWRPSSIGRPVDRQPRPRAFPAQEAYGYQPDSWFRRYYGERP
ncbi:MAG: hypothetical protein U9Q81_13750 [Pseudomonadota bacterium]|nr:hypothetical protein [Pseudomonadota bacterium]